MATGAEKREFARVDVNLEVEVASERNKVIRGHIKDLSLNGVFMACPERLASAERCSVTFVVTGMTEPLRVKAEGRVVRSDDDGMGIEFDAAQIEEGLARHFGLTQS